MTSCAKTVPFAKLLARRDLARLHAFGLGPYEEILQLQQSLRRQRVDDAIPDTWLLGEHPTVITQGARASGDDLIARSEGMTVPPIVQVDRGGMTTLHSPGQLILYPIVKLEGGSLAAGRFVHALLATLAPWIAEEFGVRATPSPGRPGLFTPEGKLMSIGISVRQSVSMHGVAINFSNDLSLWSAIVACGEAAATPVSISALAGRLVEPSAQSDSLARWLGEAWGYQRVERHEAPCV